MGQIDSFKRVLGLDIEEVDPYRRILEESKAIEAAEGNGDEEEKKAMKKKGGKSPKPPSPARTSISLSRKTFARLDCYKFWLRRDCGKDYQSFSALLDALTLPSFSSHLKDSAGDPSNLFCPPKAQHRPGRVGVCRTNTHLAVWGKGFIFMYECMT